jgi:hypothetical protein
VIVDAMYWSAVMVTCEQDPSKSRTFAHAAVGFGDGALSVAEVGDLRAGQPATVLYTKPKVVVVTPREMVFEAFWWSAKFGGNEYDALIPVRVVCRGPRTREQWVLS